jgi:zinc protease
MLIFTDLNFDQEALKALSKSSLVFLKHGIYASNYFQQEFYTYLNQNNPRFLVSCQRIKSWADTDYKVAYEKYKERFANAADFEFYFRNVDDAIGDTAAKTYIASPANDKKKKIVDLG